MRGVGGDYSGRVGTHARWLAVDTDFGHVRTPTAQHGPGVEGAPFCAILGVVDYDTLLHSDSEPSRCRYSSDRDRDWSWREFTRC
jgi:hypothetical protein